MPRVVGLSCLCVCLCGVDFIAQELDRRLEELDEDARGSNQIFKPAQVFTVPSTKAYSKESGADYVVDPSLVSHRLVIYMRLWMTNLS